MVTVPACRRGLTTANFNSAATLEYHSLALDTLYRHRTDLLLYNF